MCFYPVNMAVNRVAYGVEDWGGRGCAVEHQVHRQGRVAGAVGRLQVGDAAKFKAVAFIKSDSSAAHLVLRQFHFQHDDSFVSFFE